MNNGQILHGGRIPKTCGIIPRLDVVVIEPRALQGGIALPESVTQSDARKFGVVVAIGPDVNKPRDGQDAETFVRVNLGDEVIVSKVLEVTPDYGGKTYCLCPASAVLGRIERK